MTLKTKTVLPIANTRNHLRNLVLALTGVTILAVYIRGLYIPLMNNDSAHHALIALHMKQTGDYTQLYYRGTDYLDKPHFLFWITAASFHIFGVTSFAYKLPSLLFSLLGIYSTFRLGKKLYNTHTGIVAGIILSTSYAFVLANNDVRMDAILSGSTIFSIWQLIEFAGHRSTTSLLLSSIAMAIAFATKGAIGIILPATALLFFVLQKRQWRSILSPQWVVMALLIMLFLLPVLYCFYQQFDAHPEKVIRGETGRSGVLFALFEQSLERYGGNTWGEKNNEVLFFAHTFLWAFLPWSLVAMVALWTTVKWLWINKFKDNARHPLFLPATSIAIFVVISGSQFKLPHYLNVLLPLFALITSAFITDPARDTPRWLFTIQGFVLALMIAAVVLLNTITFPVDNPIVALFSIFLLLLCLLVLFLPGRQLLLPGVLAAIFSYFLLNFNFFPKLLRFQAGNTLAEELKDRNIRVSGVCYLDGFRNANSFDFSLQTIIPSKPAHDLQQDSCIVYTDDDGKDFLRQSGFDFIELTSAPDFTVTKLRWHLLNPWQRRHYRKKNYLLKIRPVISARK